MASTSIIGGTTSGVISEKTAELNLTIEAVNRVSSLHNRSAFAWGPTLRQEANWGFDAGLGVSGHFIYLQFKRANVEGSGHVFHLNRTSAEDQHRKLLDLEAAGCCVRYALPRFTTLSFIASNRRRLLIPPRTAWLRPSAIPVPNGGVGHHDVHIHPNRRWVTSERVEFDEPDDFPFADTSLEQFTPFSPEKAEGWISIFNKVFGDDPEGTLGGTMLFLPS